MFFSIYVHTYVRPAVLKKLTADSGSLAIKFFRTGLTCAHILTKTFKNQQNVQFSPISGVSKRKSSM